MTPRKEYKNRQDAKIVYPYLTLEDSANDDGWDNKCRCQKPIVSKSSINGTYCKVCLGDLNLN